MANIFEWAQSRVARRRHFVLAPDQNGGLQATRDYYSSPLGPLVRNTQPSAMPVDSRRNPAPEECVSPLELLAPGQDKEGGAVVQLVREPEEARLAGRKYKSCTQCKCAL